MDELETGNPPPTSEEEQIKIELIYALPNEQILFTIPVKPDTSIEEAIVNGWAI